LESIIASGLSDDNSEQHVFLVKWKDFTQEENTWERYGNVAEHNMDLLKDYYKRKPGVERDRRLRDLAKSIRIRKKWLKEKIGQKLRCFVLLLLLLFYCMEETEYRWGHQS
jgi:hypothetical protein